MQRNLLHYQRALFLRKKKGYSYNEIMAEIPVAKSTLSGWLSGIELDKSQQERIRRKQEERWSRNYDLGEWNRAKRQKEIASIRVKAKKEIGNLTKREFLIAGIMLYWAEGNKVSKGAGISNADPMFMAFMMQWLRECMSISEDRFRASIHYHEGQDYRRIEQFWSGVTNISLNHFRKPFCKPPGTGHRKHYLQWGVCRIYICRSGDLLHQILGSKDGLIQGIISGTHNVRP
jgi:transcriptional regulator with XRE-family HTH domain